LIIETEEKLKNEASLNSNYKESILKFTQINELLNRNILEIKNQNKDNLAIIQKYQCFVMDVLKLFQDEEINTKFIHHNLDNYLQLIKDEQLEKESLIAHLQIEKAELENTISNECNSKEEIISIEKEIKVPEEPGLVPICAIPRNYLQVNSDSNKNPGLNSLSIVKKESAKLIRLECEDSSSFESSDIKNESQCIVNEVRPAISLLQSFNE